MSQQIRKCNFISELDGSVLYSMQMKNDSNDWFVPCSRGYLLVFETEAERDDYIKKYEERATLCNIQ